MARFSLRPVAAAAAASVLMLSLCARESSAEMYVVVEAGTSECFVETMEDGGYVHGSFQVEDGGSLDIDLRVYSPSKKQVYLAESMNEDHFKVTAPVGGVYQFCFENRAGVSYGRKKVVFALHNGHGELLAEELELVATKRHLKPVEEKILQLSDKVLRLKEHHSYMMHRSARHQKTSESTQSRVFFSTLIEGLVLIVLNLWQVYYLKGFFETKRVI